MRIISAVIQADSSDCLQWFTHSLIISTYEYMAYSLTHEPGQ